MAKHSGISRWLLPFPKYLHLEVALEHVFRPQQKASGECFCGEEGDVHVGV